MSELEKKVLTDEELESANGGIVLNVAEANIAQTTNKAAVAGVIGTAVASGSILALFTAKDNSTDK